MIRLKQTEKLEITLEQLIDRVESCGTEEVDAVMDALQRRYKRLCPDWEVVFQAYPVREPENCRKPQIVLLDKKP